MLDRADVRVAVGVAQLDQFQGLCEILRAGFFRGRDVGEKLNAEFHDFLLQLLVRFLAAP